MIALKVLATFCLATFCLASPATLTENEKKFELLKDTIGKLSETIPEIGAQLQVQGWTPEGKEELIALEEKEELIAQGKGKF